MRSPASLGILRWGNASEQKLVLCHVWALLCQIFRIVRIGKILWDAKTLGKPYQMDKLCESCCLKAKHNHSECNVKIILQ